MFCQMAACQLKGLSRTYGWRMICRQSCSLAWGITESLLKLTRDFYARLRGLNLTAKWAQTCIWMLWHQHMYTDCRGHLAPEIMSQELYELSGSDGNAKMLDEEAGSAASFAHTLWQRIVSRHGRRLLGITMAVIYNSPTPPQNMVSAPASQLNKKQTGCSARDSSVTHLTRVWLYLPQCKTPHPPTPAPLLPPSIQRNSIKKHKEELSICFQENKTMKEGRILIIPAQSRSVFHFLWRETNIFRWCTLLFVLDDLYRWWWYNGDTGWWEVQPRALTECKITAPGCNCWNP